MDDVTLISRSAAFQVGPHATAEVKTIVVENARVISSKRGISIQLHEAADMHDIWYLFSGCMALILTFCISCICLLIISL